ncbi:MAG: Fe-only nitrogenase accessory protein AnfO [Tannerellaceae bacterium]|jgi:Fe-only nitrogenase accessory protein AnfO|nr:Fe-only nitrogenase accessory protein AnfO [Tannerellaceae bacterium]
MRIGALVDGGGETIAVTSPGKLVVYENEGEWWRCVGETSFEVGERRGVSEIREYLHVATAPLSGCRALLVRQTKGIFTAILEEELHLRVIAVCGSPKPVLDEVRDSIRASIRAAVEKAERCKGGGEAVELRPVAVGDSEEGRYRIDLVQVQEGGEGKNSKEILIPFFESVGFRELEIVCLHAPKWIEKELAGLGYRCMSEDRQDGLCHVFVRPPQRCRAAVCSGGYSRGV